MVVLIITIDLIQYMRWAVHPQYTLRDATRVLTEIVGEDAITGGSLAYPLVLENNLKAFYFVAPSLQTPESHELLLNTGFTHIAIDDLGSPVYGAVSDSPLFEYFPELENEVRLVKTYLLRDNLVRLYEVNP